MLTKEFDRIIEPISTTVEQPANDLGLFRETVRDFVATEIAPIAAELDQSNTFPMQLWQQLGAMGLLGITVSEQFGGLGCGYLEHVVAMEEISRGCAAVGLSYAAHSNLCVNQIRRFGTPEQQQQFLPKLVAGNAVGALAISEEQAGSDAINMQLTAVKHSDHFIINGRKMWITNGTEANVIVAYAKLQPSTNPRKITAFIITDDLPGITKSPKLDKLGMRGSNTCELIFNNCQVPIDRVLGKEHHGSTVLMSGLNYERLILAAGPVGIMQACLDTVLPYIRQRHQFGSPIGEFQLIQSKIADLYTSLNAAKAYLYTTAKLADYAPDQLTNRDAASVLLFAAERATKAALETIQILGGNGYCNDYPAGRLLRDAKLYEIGAGTSEIRRIIIGRELYHNKS